MKYHRLKLYLKQIFCQKIRNSSTILHSAAALYGSRVSCEDFSLVNKKGGIVYTYVVGSSRNTTGGLLSSSRATDSLFLSPPDSLSDAVFLAFVSLSSWMISSTWIKKIEKCYIDILNKYSTKCKIYYYANFDGNLKFDNRTINIGRQCRWVLSVIFYRLHVRYASKVRWVRSDIDVIDMLIIVIKIVIPTIP